MPHPDDAEFGCAGTVARWTQEGKSVVYILLTNGDKGTSDRSLTPDKLAAIRQVEQREAAKVLGVKEVVYLRYPDQGLEDSPELRKDIVRQIRLYLPDVVVTLDPYRRYIWHRDHRIAGQVVLDAVYPYARDHLSYPDMLAEGLEPHKVKEMYFYTVGHGEIPVGGHRQSGVWCALLARPGGLGQAGSDGRPMVYGGRRGSQWQISPPDLSLRAMHLFAVVSGLPVERFGLHPHACVGRSSQLRVRRGKYRA